MEYKYAGRARFAAPTLIRMANDYAAGNPDFIFFSVGNPSVETFPAKELRELADEVLAEDYKSCLPYGENPGYPPLRALVRERLVKRGILKADDDNDLFITPGSGHGMDLMTMTFCDPGDEIIVEEFTYTGIIGSARCMGASLVGVKMEGDGMDMADLEEKLRTHPRAKFIYLVPTFSNPTGITWSMEKRKALYALSQKYDIMIYEDDPYGELRYSGTPVDTVKSLDTDGRVVYAGSFSKILSAGLRVGYVVCDKSLYTKLSCAAGNVVVASNLAQMVMAKYMERYDLDAHIQKACDYYGKKARAMKEALDRCLPEGWVRTDPEGGLFMWVTAPEKVDAMEMWKELLSMGVGLAPSASFAPDRDNPGHAFRLNYSRPSIEDIEKGCEIFGKVSGKYTK